MVRPVLFMVMLSVLDPVSSKASRSRLVGVVGVAVSRVIERAVEVALILPSLSSETTVMLYVPSPKARAISLVKT